MSTDSEASIKLTASFLYKSFLNTGEIYVWSYMMGIPRHFTDTYVLYVCRVMQQGDATVLPWCQVDHVI